MRLVKNLSTRQVRKIVRRIGMSISDDGLAFTVCGGQLTNWQKAPEWIIKMNGFTCEEVAEEVLQREERTK